MNSHTLSHFIVEAGLIAIAQALKTTVAEVYEAMIRKQIAVSISDLCYGLFGLLFGFFAYRILKMPDDKLLGDGVYGYRNWKPQWVVSFILMLTASIGFLIAFAVNFQEMIMGFYAPKYGAIQEIVQIVDTLLK